MLNLKSKLLTVAAFLCGASFALAQDSGPLIDILVKKGLINDQEAEELRADLVKDFAANTSAGKLNLGTTLTELKISGDVRVRYEDRGGELPSGDNLERDRFRYRFRTSLAGKMVNNWSFGVRLETAAGSRSSNVTMGDDAGPFAKTNDTVNVGQIYATWTPTPEWTFTFGRMANPLVSTSMVWDADINPEGIAEQYKHRVGQNEFGFNLGQFLYSTSGNQNTTSVTAAAPAGAKDLYLAAFQGTYKRYIEGATTYFQITPAIYTYYNTDQRKNPAAFNSFMTATNAAPVNNLLVLDVPLEYDWVAANGVPLRVFADVAINFDADQRAAKFGRPDLNGEDKAYHAGIQYGKASLPGEWDAKVFYQSVGLFALDTNLVDSDLFDSKTNMQGFVFNANYALGAATQLGFTAGVGGRKDKSVIAAGSGDIGANNALDKFWVYQLDLLIKF
jgi:polyhydroxyalkanoate synthesis regulator phasin